MNFVIRPLRVKSCGGGHPKTCLPVSAELAARLRGGFCWLAAQGSRVKFYPDFPAMWEMLLMPTSQTYLDYLGMFERKTCCFPSVTLPETNIAAESRPSQEEHHL